MLGDYFVVDRVDVFGVFVDFNVGVEVEVGDCCFYDFDSGVDVVNLLVVLGVY